jgi:hypothetical protein
MCCDVQRLARPWDAPDVELTFSPKISKKSKQLMAEARGSEGSGDFLDRLGNDMRRREAKQKVSCTVWHCTRVEATVSSTPRTAVAPCRLEVCLCNLLGIPCA